MDRLNWVAVDSTALQSIAWQPPDLWVRFHSHEIYRYRNIPPSLHDQLVAADSIGGFFNKHIRDHYPFEHLPRSFSA